VHPARQIGFRLIERFRSADRLPACRACAAAL
jgi:hypothetical protein